MNDFIEVIENCTDELTAHICGRAVISIDPSHLRDFFWGIERIVSRRIREAVIKARCLERAEWRQKLRETVEKELESERRCALLRDQKRSVN